MDKRTLRSSNFRLIYEPMAKFGVPRRTTKLLFAVEKIVQLYTQKVAQKHSIAKQLEDDFFENFNKDLAHIGSKVAETSVAAEFLWTSTNKVGDTEFCSLLNSAIR